MLVLGGTLDISKLMNHNRNKTDLKYSELRAQGDLERQTSWVMNLLIALDQLGNAIAGGNPDSTISARIGFFVSKGESSTPRYWTFLETIVDFAFLPIDCKNHSIAAFENDPNEYFKEGGFLFKFKLALITIPVALVLSVLIRIIVLFFPKARCEFYLKGEPLTLDEVNELRK